MRFLLDAHLDLAWNAMSFDRDQTLSLEQMNAREAHMTGKSRGHCTVSLPELRKARVGICLATLLARALPAVPPAPDANLGHFGVRKHGETILREGLDYANQTIACANAQSQLAYYRLLEEQGHLRMIRDVAALDDLASSWQGNGTKGAITAPIGFILSMEGADPMIEPRHAEWWWKQGLRTACLAHYGPSAYAMGTGGDGPLTSNGRHLVKEFKRLGIILDLVHTADTALDQAMDLYDGPVFVSHGNCRALVPHDRQISDEQINRIAERGGVLGVVLDSWMLVPNMRSQPGSAKSITLDAVADHIDHICQVTGSRNHAGIGSDLDGGFGNEQTPDGVNTITDLQNLAPILTKRGYSEADINGIFHNNWLRFFRTALPK